MGQAQKKASQSKSDKMEPIETPHSMNIKAAIKGHAEDVDGIAGKRLLSFLERIERLEEEKAAMLQDIKEVYGEAKATGFDVKTMRKVVRLRSMDVEKRREEQGLLEVYIEAVGLSL